MALRLVMGPSGSGKTYFLYKYALDEAAKHPERNYLIIVPEQFTLSTQRELIRLSDKHGILNVDVLSFNRLAYRIFEEVGFKDLQGSALDDMGKNLILMHAASNISGELTVFSENIRKLGYITEIKSAISEFMQYGISPEKLDEMIKLSESGGKTYLSQKLKDISRLYTEFNAYIRDKYITTEEVLTKAALAAEKSEKLKNSVILFDGFTGFTPVQYSLIEALLRITVDMHFTILYDNRSNYEHNKEHELFYLGFQTREKLYAIAKNDNICIEKEYLIKDDIPIRFLQPSKLNNSSDKNDSQLIWLERNIFRNQPAKFEESSKTGKKPTETVNGGIALFTAQNPMDEVIKIAVEIQKIIQSNERIRYKDIAIATADMENYIPLFKRIFGLYNIPYFIDRSQPVLLNPFIEFVRSLISAAADNFSYNSVFRLLRSPILSFNKGEIDTLDNFILARGVKGHGAWKKSFEENYGCDSNISNKYNLKTLDIIRVKLLGIVSPVMDLITAVDKKIRQKPTILVNELNRVLISVFEQIDVENRINELIEQYSETDDMFENNHCYEYEGIYKNTTDLLDRMSELLGEEKITIDEYGELLDAGFDEIRIGIIPKITDYIQIGDTTRSRFNDVHVLFIVGANDGNIPGNNACSGVISDIEKEFLLNNMPDIELAPTSRVKAYTCQLYLYMLMTKPKDKLYISFSRLNNDCESLRPSYIIKVLTDMFPCIEFSGGYDSEFDVICNFLGIYSVLSGNIKDEGFSDLIPLIINESKNIEKDKHKLRALIDCAFTTGVLRGNDVISKAVSNVIYGNVIRGSVTNLERYARCAFRYYMEYGLSVRERELFSFDRKDMGTVLHSSLQKYGMLLRDEGLLWTDVDNDKRDELIRKAVEISIDNEKGNVLNSSFRYKYMVERITKIINTSVDAITRQLEKGDFVPRAYELRFGGTDMSDKSNEFIFDLSDGEKLMLRGTVDRLDTYETDDKLYMKIIDYKSGNRSLDLLEVYKGLQLQLAVYMNACKLLLKKETDKEILPAGILYYHLDYPLSEKSLFSDDNEIADDILMSLRPKGLVSIEDKIYCHMDKHIEGASDVIPVKLTSKNNIDNRSSTVASADDFDVISRYVNKKICDIGKEILSGNIKAGSNVTKKEDDCKYCPYTEICKFYLFNIASDDDDNTDEGSDVKQADNTGNAENIDNSGNSGNSENPGNPDANVQNINVTKKNVLEFIRKEVGDGGH